MEKGGSNRNPERAKSLATPHYRPGIVISILRMEKSDVQSVQTTCKNRCIEIPWPFRTERGLQHKLALAVLGLTEAERVRALRVPEALPTHRLLNLARCVNAQHCNV